MNTDLGPNSNSPNFLVTIKSDLFTFVTMDALERLVVCCIFIDERGQEIKKQTTYGDYCSARKIN